MAIHHQTMGRIRNQRLIVTAPLGAMAVLVGEFQTAAQDIQTRTSPGWRWED